MPEFIANRYLVKETIGQGGMAVVYRVLDTVTDSQLALKQLVVQNDPQKQNKIAEFFEHEFYTLTQLAHPRVIEVYDFGKNEAGLYYTMELLDGGDLRALSPLPWRKLCSLLCDICSALSLLHSRRLVHRDLTPRNVRCTLDGRAKLIDFGAMVPMGHCKQVMGTAPFTAPESVNFQSLDARVDLYALGATAYYALTRRHAFPAKNLKELRDMWRSVPKPPSFYKEDIPKGLDNLVMSLINLDPMARPINAAEVMEKLHAIAEIEIDEQLIVPQAYLVTPSLVGRERQILRIRKQMIRSWRRRGGSFIIEGASGTGRSRFLDACVLEGKLMGATVLRTDASDSRRGNWKVAKILFEQLINANPEIAAEAAEAHFDVLGHVFPDMVKRCIPYANGKRVTPFRPPSSTSTYNDSSLPEETNQSEDAVDPLVQPGDSTYDPRVFVWGRGVSLHPSPPTRLTDVDLAHFDDPKELRPRVQKALRDVFLKVCDKINLVLAIDDFHEVDEPSAAFLALLVHERSQERLTVVVTVESDSGAVSAHAIKLLSEAGSSIKLRNLSLGDTEKLLGSIFGEAANLKLLSDRLFTISQGNPRAIMQLAQNLVDRGTIRYRAGAWTLPSRIDAKDIPKSLTEALKAQVEALDDETRKLAITMALSSEQNFTYDECIILSGHQDNSRVIQQLNQLVTFAILKTDGFYYALSHKSWVAVLTDKLDEGQKRASHLRLSSVFAARGSEDFHVSRHLLKAGEDERALDIMVNFAISSRTRFVQSAEAFTEFVRTLPADWDDTFFTLREIHQRLQRSETERYWLDRIFLTYRVHDGADSSLHLKIIEQICDMSGLKIYHELDASDEPSARLTRALELAQQRYDATPTADRIFTPEEAIRELARNLALAIVLAGTSFDYHFIASMPSLKPLLPLSPTLEVIEKNVKTTCHINAGRYEEGIQGYRELLDRISQPDRAGMEESVYTYVRLSFMFAIGTYEAGFGLDTALDWAKQIEVNPLFEVNAWRIRFRYNLAVGNDQEVKVCRRRLELLEIENSPEQFFEGHQYWPELVVYSFMDDLIRVKQLLPYIEKMARLYESWIPILHYAKGEYQRIRGDYISAIVEFENCLNRVKPGHHVVWPRVAGSYLKVLFGLSRIDKAKQAGLKFIEDAAATRLRITSLPIREAMALVDTKLGNYEDAVRTADTIIEECNAIGAKGVVLGMAYEARARVAIAMQDEATFAAYAARCAEQYNVGRNSTLTAKYEKLMGEAMQSIIGLSDINQEVPDTYDMLTDTALSFISRSLTECCGPQERADQALVNLVRHSNCAGGFLYFMQNDGPILCAKMGNQPLPAGLDKMVEDYLSAELECFAEVTMTQSELVVADAQGDEPDCFICEKNDRYHPVILGHESEEGFIITGLAVLLMDKQRDFVKPDNIVTLISRTLLDAGDVTSFYAAN